MTSLRTGAARLFFLACEKGLDVNIVPVGLNYEQGSVFRTPVVVSVASPVDTSAYIEKHENDPNNATRELTDEIGRTLNKHVFQAGDFRDRDLMMLLDRIYSLEPIDDSWPERLKRLKKFESGLNTVHDSCSHEIARLRHMLSKYEVLSRTVEKKHPPCSSNTPRSIRRFFMALGGLPIATLGALFNILPYKVCGLLVKSIKKHHEAEAATYKVVYSIFLYPLAFFGEGLLLHWWFGWSVSIPFAIGIIPLSYFTLYFFEWFAKGGWGISIPIKRIEKIHSHQISKRLHNQRLRIQDQVDTLANRFNTYIEE
jgi:hypothetical protein